MALREEDFAGRYNSHAPVVFTQKQRTTFIDAFEHAACLLMRQSGSNPATQTGCSCEPGVTDCCKPLAAPNLIPFGEVGREVKKGDVGLVR